MKGCKSIEEYKLRQFVDKHFIDMLPRYYNEHLHTIAVKDDSGEMIVFKLIDGVVTEIKV